VKRGNWSHLGYSNTRYVLWKKLEERVRSVAKFGDWVSLGSLGSSHKQDPHLQGTNEKAEIYTTVFHTQDASSYVTKELWTVLQINPIRICAIVTALTT
jgi:hypothetical protein